jgi:hypothetical protein
MDMNLLVWVSGPNILHIIMAYQAKWTNLFPHLAIIAGMLNGKLLGWNDV